MATFQTICKMLATVIGMILICIPALAAESSGSGKPGTQQERKAFQEQNSDKRQQGQGLINEQRMAPQISDMQSAEKNTGADLSGGRDSHLGPQDRNEPGRKR